jgi:hypothetical protein
VGYAATLARVAPVARNARLVASAKCARSQAQVPVLGLCRLTYIATIEARPEVTDATAP